MKLKILLWSIVLILILGLATGAFWWLRRPQVITFSSGDKLTLLAVDYGKKHTAPGVKAAAKPARGGGRNATSFTTPTDTLVLWVRQEHEPNQYAYFQYFVYDKAETACVQTFGSGGSQQASQVVSVQLQAFPRRAGKFIVRVQEQGNGGQEVADQKFVISNPARGPFPTWTAEALPDAKDDDDFSATLTKLVSGANSNMNRNQDNPDDAMNKGVQATFNVSYKGKPVTNWQPVAIDTSDATGNRVNGWCNSQWQDNDDLVTYQWGLWPDEAAWKLKVEFSKQSGFDDSELWTVKNLPVVPGRQQDFWNYGNRRGAQTNTVAAFAETDLKGVHLKIFPATQFTDQNMGNGQMEGGLHIQVTPSLPAGMRMTFVKLTDDQGQDIQNYSSGSSGNGKSTTLGYQLRDIAGVTNINVTIALHPSHFIEFTAKPEKAPATAAQ
jgi:hypothetical protein